MLQTAPTVVHACLILLQLRRARSPLSAREASLRTLRGASLLGLDRFSKGVNPQARTSVASRANFGA